MTLVEQAWMTSDPTVLGVPCGDLYGNRGHRLRLPAGTSEYAWTATVTVPDAVDSWDPAAIQHPVEDLPDDVLTFLWPSRSCSSDLLSADAWRLFGGSPPTFQRVLDIASHVHERVEYRPGSTQSWWSAWDAYDAGYGMCRDLSHTFITLCRALTIPARSISGYLPDMDVEPSPLPMDVHAWAEVHVDGRWWTVDPRHNEPREGHIVIGRGPDAADVPLLTTFGAPQLDRMEVTCHEMAAGDSRM